MGEHDPTRDDVEALLETRRELGPSYDAARVDTRVAARSERDRQVAAAGPRQLALAILSLIACIPISIVLGLNDALVPMVVALAAIVSINVAHALQARSRD